jgi:hypothetical protein
MPVPHSLSGQALARQVILEFSDDNMAGSEWTWSFFLNRTANGRFTVSCSQKVSDGGRQQLTLAARGLTNGAAVYAALVEMVEDAGYAIDDDSIPDVAGEIAKIDSLLVVEFVNAFSQARALEEETENRVS